MFANVPPNINLERISARLTHQDGTEVDPSQASVVASSVSEYNQFFAQQSRNFVPVIDRPGLKVFRVVIVPGTQPLGYWEIGCEIYDRQDRLGAVRNSISVLFAE